VQGSSVAFSVTPSLIPRPPSSSAPACDSEWSLYEKKKSAICQKNIRPHAVALTGSKHGEGELGISKDKTGI